MPARITLRPVLPQDEPFLFALYASTRTEELAPVDWDDAQKESFLRMQFAAQQQFYKDRFAQARFDVVLAGDRPIGRLYVDRREDEIRVIDIALLTEHRGAGIGSELLRDLLAEAAGLDKPVRIHVERFNPALRLYERLGFTRVADHGVYYLMEWSKGDRD